MSSGSASPLASTVREADDRPEVSARLCLLVIGDDHFSTHSIEEHGELSIGRDTNSDVCIDEPSISRRHAVVHFGATPLIEDLGSANGTRVGGVRVPVGRRVPVRLGEVIDVGTVMMIFQTRATPVRPRRIWAHGYFEARLEEEVARADRSSGSFGVLLLASDDKDLPTYGEMIAEILRPGDIIGRYAPGVFEILLPDTPPHVAERLSQKLGTRLARAATNVEVGLACYPRDGRDPDSLAAAARAAVRRSRGAASVTATAPADEATAAPMQHLRRLVERIAKSHISVLIGGETGVGKEVMAETIHRLSPRRDRPFLRLNCAALSETLLESELFGYERGAFTGATQSKIGLLESAQGGTVFLDEVGELPLSTQVKLLRVLEERQVLPVGAIKPRAIDVRFIAATNRDLEVEVAQRTFRQDLLFRLNAVSLVIPPLRDRSDEIDGLVQTFLARASREAGRERPLAISAAAVELLRAYSWPGNIRELRNVIERAVVLAEGEDTITPEHLPVEKLELGTIAPAPAPMSATASPAPVAAAAADVEGSPVERLRLAVQDEERRRIYEALQACAGNQTRAAALLGIARRTLVKRLKVLGMPRPRKGC